MAGKLFDFDNFKRRAGQSRQSALGRQIEQTLCPGMILPDPLEQLFKWIELKGLYIDTPNGRLGFMYPEEKIKSSRTNSSSPGGTDISFAAEGNINLRYWFRTTDSDVMERLCVFAKTGAEGSMAAFWLAEDGSQKIVHLGSGSGSTTICILAHDPVDFLRLIAIGYDEICWGEDFAEPPNASGKFIVGPNYEYIDWVTKRFGVTIPDRALSVVPYPISIDAPTSPDPFWQWVRRHTG